jgi:hypothetical protein
MKKWILPATLAVALTGFFAVKSQRPTDFGEQFITLPSGKQAYCNRQGYREVRRTYTYEQNMLVTDPDGNFVVCDAKVGPPWDPVRTDDAGNLLMPGQMDDLRRAEQEKDVAARAEQGQREVEWARRNDERWAREEAENQARIDADKQARARVQAQERAINEAKARCRAPYEIAYKAYMDDMRIELGKAVDAATHRMDECLEAVEQGSAN